MVMPIVGMKMIGSVAPALTVGAAGVVVEILLLGPCSSLLSTLASVGPEEASQIIPGLWWGCASSFPGEGFEGLRTLCVRVGAILSVPRLITGCISGMLPVALALLPSLGRAFWERERAIWEEKEQRAAMAKESQSEKMINLRQTDV